MEGLAAHFAGLLALEITAPVARAGRREARLDADLVVDLKNDRLGGPAAALAFAVVSRGPVGTRLAALGCCLSCHNAPSLP